MTEEIFRIAFKSQEAYTEAKKTIAADVAAIDITSPIFSFDDVHNIVMCRQSHFYARMLFAGRQTSKALGLDCDTYDYFTNRTHDQSVFSVIPNIECYKKKRQEALDFYKTYTPASSPPLGIDLSNTNSGEVISKLLAYPKSCIGDYHEHRAPKAAIINNMQTLKTTGTVLLLENLFVDQQPMLDAYLAGQDSRYIAPEIRLYCENSDQRNMALGNYGLVGILKAAHKYGVPVRGIEEPFALDAGAFGAIAPLSDMKLHDEETTFNRYDRLLMMNHNAVKAAEDLERQGIRSITFCGGGHLGDYVHSSGRKIPGLANSYGAPMVEIWDMPVTFSGDRPPHSDRIFYDNPDNDHTVGTKQSDLQLRSALAKIERTKKKIIGWSMAAVTILGGVAGGKFGKAWGTKVLITRGLLGASVGGAAGYVIGKIVTNESSNSKEILSMTANSAGKNSSHVNRLNEQQQKETILIR